ncbi:hypothetical protein AGMMS50222_05430 [Endomicrobiia bacterium]|nr:hypothetical protein AGMMS49531_04670 [Endomicrobiia bacterium]GHT65028.1 hypothetical protein AGMMS49556_04130 [Endomicrobiia bacterium]GHT69896.1 hypothetical protein AGMMS49950_03610 [Endomicrobiia bacterium]GHT75094.1 hypothetical protein AGMMS50222_05430 [Endomicrobiia bacterium]
MGRENNPRLLKKPPDLMLLKAIKKIIIKQCKDVLKDIKMKKIVSFLVLSLSFSIASCVSVNKYVTTRYAPTNADKIEVYSTQLPKKEYIELAEIKSQEEDIMTLKEEAAKLGADAIIMTGANSVNANTIHTPEAKCVAIKFKNSSSRIYRTDRNQIARRRYNDTKRRSR